MDIFDDPKRSIRIVEFHHNHTAFELAMFRSCRERVHAASKAPWFAFIVLVACCVAMFGCRSVPSEAAIAGVGIGKADPPPECRMIGAVSAGDIDPDHAYRRLRQEAGDLGGNYVVIDSMRGRLTGRAYFCPASYAGPTGTAGPRHRILFLPLPDAVAKNDRHFTEGSGDIARAAVRRAFGQAVELIDGASADDQGAFREARHKGAGYVLRARLLEWESYQMRPSTLAMTMEVYDSASARLVLRLSERLAGTASGPADGLLTTLCEKLAAKTLSALPAPLPPPQTSAVLSTNATATAHAAPNPPPSIVTAPSAETPVSRPPGSTDPSPTADAPRCVPGLQIECPCLGQQKGVQVCATDGRRYEPCQCGSKPPGQK